VVTTQQVKKQQDKKTNKNCQSPSNHHNQSIKLVPRQTQNCHSTTRAVDFFPTFLFLLMY
jgi:hypothetical protein